MTPKLRHILAGLALALLAFYGVATGLDSCHRRQGTQGEQTSQIQHQEAQSHAQAAQAIPYHSQALAKAQADADRARAEVRRLRKLLDAQAPGVHDPDSAGDAGAVPIAPDHRDELLVAQDALIKAQDTQIQGLKLALTDEQARSGEWQQAYQHEQQARLAQEAATNAWKSAVKESRWRGRIEGFAAGVALGYAGGKL